MRGDLPGLEPLRSGVWRHYKGPLYQCLGYGHDANADVPFSRIHSAPLGEGRIVVIYVPLMLDGAHTGPRMAVRTADDWWATVHADTGTRCEKPVWCDYPCCGPRFAYLGDDWQPWMIDAEQARRALASRGSHLPLGYFTRTTEAGR